MILKEANLVSLHISMMDPKYRRQCPKFFNSCSLLSSFIALCLLFLPSSAQLSSDFYIFSCPTVELIVSNAVRSASNTDSSITGKLLRLLFHDCMVEGCDGSVLVEGSGTERSDPANRSLGGFDVVESAKRMLEFWCPGTVSCADILVLAARDAVEIAGGPLVEVPLGRRDGRLSLASNVRPNIIDTGFSVDQMSKVFSSKGLSIDDLVLLSGAHTIGSAHCNAFSERFQQLSNGSLVPVDGSLNADYAKQLSKKCPAGASSSNVTVNMDPVTAASFDNQYYSNLLAGKGLLQSDSALVSDLRTKGKVEAFSKNKESFFASWADSFVKLSSIDVKTGFVGEVRVSCMKVN